MLEYMIEWLFIRFLHTKLNHDSTFFFYLILDASRGCKYNIEEFV